ncbi:MAG: DUF971 domain-containing protein [Planctomycetia bacterium]|nr:DUF971 domain-containing protein [Planctomycetia bacterium]
MSQPVPVSIGRLDAAGGAIEIGWSDGGRRRYTARQLRDACPCATCRERRVQPAAAGPLAVLAPEEIAPLSITGMKPVGQYAYSIEFSDGHSSGIYALDYLHELGRDSTTSA